MSVVSIGWCSPDITWRAARMRAPDDAAQLYIAWDHITQRNAHRPDWPPSVVFKNHSISSKATLILDYNLTLYYMQTLANVMFKLSMSLRFVNFWSFIIKASDKYCVKY